jgi:protein-disulfide isomerase
MLPALEARLTNGVLTACAVTLTVILVLREIGPDGPKQIERQRDWLSYVDGGHRLGPPNPRAILIEFADFECPACARLDQHLREALRRYSGFAIQYRHYPLPAHRHAFAAAVASECAAEQARFGTMHAVLFDGRDSLGVIPWTDLAGRAGVANLPAFERCMADSARNEKVHNDIAAARKLRVAGTPTLLLNGRRINGNIPAGKLDSLIEAALRAGAANLRRR